MELESGTVDTRLQREWREGTGMGQTQGTIIQKSWKIGLMFMAQQSTIV